MNFTLTCPNCGEKLRLFDMQIKRRRGTVRCTRCGSRVAYDLSCPRPERIGFWAVEETPFKPAAKEKLLSVIRARQKKAGLTAAGKSSPAKMKSLRQTTPRPDSPFQAFDLRTGQIIPGPKRRKD